MHGAITSSFPRRRLHFLHSLVLPRSTSFGRTYRRDKPRPPDADALLNVCRSSSRRNSWSRCSSRGPAKAARLSARFRWAGRVCLHPSCSAALSPSYCCAYSFQRLRRTMRQLFKGRTALALALPAALALLFLAAIALKGQANSIDNVHWIGNPLPPCFEDAKVCGGHLLGTDAVGRDLLDRLIVGTAVTVAGSCAVLIVEAFLVFLVTAVSRAGGIGRYAILRLADAFSAFPAWPLLVVVAFPLRLLPVGIVAAALIAPAAIRLAILQPATRSFADRAAKDAQRIIILLSTLGLFGYGTQPPTPSLGNMLSDAQMNLQIAWWAAVFPAVAIFTVVLSIELCRRLSWPNDQHRNTSAA